MIRIDTRLKMVKSIVLIRYQSHHQGKILFQTVMPRSLDQANESSLRHICIVFDSHCIVVDAYTYIRFISSFLFLFLFFIFFIFICPPSRRAQLSRDKSYKETKRSAYDR